MLAATQDEATSAMYTECFEALELIGGQPPFQMEYRASFALVGYKGTRNVNWVQQKKEHFGQGPTVIDATVKLLKT